MDPPREEAIRAVANCQAAGIRVKMITGDHGVTAQAIGASMGIGDGQALHRGRGGGPGRRGAAAGGAETDVFARASPEHKLRLVQALQANGEVVAMTGDGVNDAPALKRADIGVAMGSKGTEAAKEAAAVVLADDNFATIAAAVEEGRTVYDNIARSHLFMLPTNGGEAAGDLVAVLARAAPCPSPPVQILWVNMVTAVTLALALAFEPAEPGVMQRQPPRPPSEPLITRPLGIRIAYVSLLMTLITLVAFEWELTRGSSWRWRAPPRSTCWWWGSCCTCSTCGTSPPRR